MSWPLIIGITAGVIAADLYSQKIKRDAKQEEKNKMFNFSEKIPSITKKEVVYPREQLKVKVKKLQKNKRMIRIILFYMK